MTQQYSSTALIMAGGTGGHIFPGIAVAKALRLRGWKIRWLGSRGGMEEKLVAAESIELKLISVAGLRGNGLLGWIKSPFSLTKAVFEATKIIRKEMPSVVIGFGGFASGPGGLAAFLTGTPLIIHEQNAIAGLTNRVLAKMAKKVFQAFPETFKSSKNIETVGNPLRSEIVDLNQLDNGIETDLRAKNILVIGGSRGALALNKYLPQVFAELLKNNEIFVRHQVGSNRLIETRQYYSEVGLGQCDTIELVEFIDNIADAFKWADLVVCRAGASTVSEIAAAGRCAIFIPYPFAVDDHQTANANWLVKQQAALCFSESDMKKELFLEAVKELIQSPEKIGQMGKNAKKIAFLKAADKVADYCDDLRKLVA